MQGCFNACKLINVIYHNTDLKINIMCSNAEQATDKIQHHFMIGIWERIRIQGIYVNIIKANFSKLTVNINLNGEKVKTVPLKLGTSQGYPWSPYLFNIEPETPN